MNFEDIEMAESLGLKDSSHSYHLSSEHHQQMKQKNRNKNHMHHHNKDKRKKSKGHKVYACYQCSGSSDNNTDTTCNPNTNSYFQTYSLPKSVQGKQSRFDAGGGREACKTCNGVKQVDQNDSMVGLLMQVMYRKLGKDMPTLKNFPVLQFSAQTKDPHRAKLNHSMKHGTMSRNPSQPILSCTQYQRQKAEPTPQSNSLSDSTSQLDSSMDSMSSHNSSSASRPLSSLSSNRKTRSRGNTLYACQPSFRQQISEIKQESYITQDSVVCCDLCRKEGQPGGNTGEFMECRVCRTYFICTDCYNSKIQEIQNAKNTPNQADLSGMKMRKQKSHAQNSESQHPSISLTKNRSLQVHLTSQQNQDKQSKKPLNIQSSPGMQSSPTSPLKSLTYSKLYTNYIHEHPLTKCCFNQHHDEDRDRDGYGYGYGEAEADKQVLQYYSGEDHQQKYGDYLRDGIVGDNNYDIQQTYGRIDEDGRYGDGKQDKSHVRQVEDRENYGANRNIYITGNYLEPQKVSVGSNRQMPIRNLFAPQSPRPQYLPLFDVIKEEKQSPSVSASGISMQVPSSSFESSLRHNDSQRMDQKGSPQGKMSEGQYQFEANISITVSNNLDSPETTKNRDSLDSPPIRQAGPGQNRQPETNKNQSNNSSPIDIKLTDSDRIDNIEHVGIRQSQDGRMQDMRMLHLISQPENKREQIRDRLIPLTRIHLDTSEWSQYSNLYIEDQMQNKSILSGAKISKDADESVECDYMNTAQYRPSNQPQHVEKNPLSVSETPKTNTGMQNLHQSLSGMAVQKKQKSDNNQQKFYSDKKKHKFQQIQITNEPILDHNEKPSYDKNSTQQINDQIDDDMLLQLPKIDFKPQTNKPKPVYIDRSEQLKYLRAQKQINQLRLQKQIQEESKWKEEVLKKMKEKVRRMVPATARQEQVLKKCSNCGSQIKNRTIYMKCQTCSRNEGIKYELCDQCYRQFQVTGQHNSNSGNAKDKHIFKAYLFRLSEGSALDLDGDEQANQDINQDQKHVSNDNGLQTVQNRRQSTESNIFKSTLSFDYHPSSQNISDLLPNPSYTFNAEQSPDKLQQPLVPEVQMSPEQQQEQREYQNKRNQYYQRERARQLSENSLLVQIYDKLITKVYEQSIGVSLNTFIVDGNQMSNTEQKKHEEQQSESKPQTKQKTDVSIIDFTKIQQTKQSISQGRASINVGIDGKWILNPDQLRSSYLVENYNKSQVMAEQEQIQVPGLTTHVSELFLKPLPDGPQPQRIASDHSEENAQRPSQLVQSQAKDEPMSIKSQELNNEQDIIRITPVSVKNQQQNLRKAEIKRPTCLDTQKNKQGRRHVEKKGLFLLPQMGQRDGQSQSPTKSKSEAESRVVIDCGESESQFSLHAKNADIHNQSEDYDGSNSNKISILQKGSTDPMQQLSKSISIAKSQQDTHILQREYAISQPQQQQQQILQQNQMRESLTHKKKNRKKSGQSNNSKNQQKINNFNININNNSNNNNIVADRPGIRFIQSYEVNVVNYHSKNLIQGGVRLSQMLAVRDNEKMEGSGQSLVARKLGRKIYDSNYSNSSNKEKEKENEGEGDDKMGFLGVLDKSEKLSKSQEEELEAYQMQQFPKLLPNAPASSLLSQKSRPKSSITYLSPDRSTANPLAGSQFSDKPEQQPPRRPPFLPPYIPAPESSHNTDQNTFIFSDYSCDMCGKSPTNYRYHCRLCQDYDLCEKCYRKNKHVHRQPNDFVKIGEKQEMQLSEMENMMKEEETRKRQAIFRCVFQKFVPGAKNMSNNSQSGVKDILGRSSVPQNRENNQLSSSTWRMSLNNGNTNYMYGGSRSNLQQQNSSKNQGIQSKSLIMMGRSLKK